VKKYAPLLLLLLFVTACSDPDLNKISKALVVTAKTNGEIQTDVIAANAANLLSDNNTRVILEMCQKVNYGGKEATALTRAISKLDDPSKAQILTILKPVIVAVQNAIDTGLIGITDQATKEKIQLLLLSIQSTLNSIQIIVAGGV
jgi:hypothetical protein